MAKFPGKLWRRSSLLIQIQERDLITPLLKDYPQAGNGCPRGRRSSSEGRCRKAKVFERGTKCRERKAHCELR